MKSITLFLFSSLLGVGLILFYFRGYIFPGSINLHREPQTTLQTSPFSLEKAPSDSMSGNILSLSGSVYWQSRIATEPSALKAKIPIQQGEKIVTGEDGNISLELGSANLVTISPKTELAFVQTLATNFVFQQEQGTVSYTKIDQTPLAVRSLTLLTQIASGSANIITSKKDGLVTVEVNKGFVTIGYNDADFNSQVINVEAGKKIIFNDDEKTIKIKTLL